MRSKEEDYLDNLLNSLSGDIHSEEKTDKKNKSNLFRTPEAEFLKQFEAELNSDEDSDYMKEFEMELDSFEKKQEEPVESDYIIKDKEQTFSSDPVPMNEESQEDDFDLKGIISGAKNHMEETAVQEQIQKSSFEEEETEDDIRTTIFEPIEGENIDLSGNENSDLMDILGEEDDLSDIKELLLGKEMPEVEDSFDDFAAKEMNAEEANLDEELGSEEKDSKREKKKKNRRKKKSEANDLEKKPSIFKKISTVLFGDEEASELTEITTLTEDMIPDISELTAESMQVLADMDLEDAGKKKEKKSKKEKAKKEKTKKEKPKKEKKKEKKTREQKPVEYAPPLPKVPVILVFVMVFSLLVLIMLGATQMSYQSKIQNANIHFAKGRYTDAYTDLEGISLKEKDQVINEKVKLMASVQGQLESYYALRNSSQQEMAFNALIMAAGRSDNLSENAEKIGCSNELNDLVETITTELANNYQMQYPEAVEIYQSSDRTEYTYQLRNKLKELGLE